MFSTVFFGTSASAQNISVLATGTRLYTTGVVVIGTGINWCKSPNIDLSINKVGTFSGYVSTAFGMKPVINYTVTVANEKNCVLKLPSNMSIKDIIGHLWWEYIPNTCTNSSVLNNCTLMPSSVNPGLFNVYWWAISGAVLQPYASTTVSFSIISHELISQTNTACAVISNDSNQANNCITINTPIPPAPCLPDLAINKVWTLNWTVSTAFGPKPLILYTLTVINVGSCTANLSWAILTDQIGDYFGDYVNTSCINSPLLTSCIPTSTPSGFFNLLWNGLGWSTLAVWWTTTVAFNAISYEATSQTNSACINIPGDTNPANNCMTINTTLAVGYGYGNLTAGWDSSFLERGIEAVVEKLTK